MPLFLLGGGEQEAFANLDRVFLDSLPAGSNLLVIPQACDPEDYEDILERIESCFGAAKIKAIHLASNLDIIDANTLDQYAAIIIEGGNTFQLIQTVRQSSFFNLLKDFLASGKSIYADSAGAIILGEDVRTAFLGDEADEDLNKLQNYRGLSLLESWIIHCHYKLEEAESLSEMVFNLGLPILALSEETGLLVDGDKIRVFGKEMLEVFTFVGRRDYPVNSEFTLAEVLG